MSSYVKEKHKKRYEHVVLEGLPCHKKCINCITYAVKSMYFLRANSFYYTLAKVGQLGLGLPRRNKWLNFRERTPFSIP